MPFVHVFNLSFHEDFIFCDILVMCHTAISHPGTDINGSPIAHDKRNSVRTSETSQTCPTGQVIISVEYLIYT
jgi:hypothetical protein